MTNTMTQTSRDLEQFTGRDNWYRHGINRRVLYTDGARHVAETGGAYWLLDAIAICQKHVSAVAAEEFQAWKLSVMPDRTAGLRGRQRQCRLLADDRVDGFPAR